ncbi:Uncharacterised protein [Moraxella lacunata]|uniref:NinB protein n=1 Tax=Moraxella lacunata TaxID=477 RepID=A0A378QHS0_MORLA|nr:recombination protein NinB [Moraxella lacunata]STY99844.1 Uncharacterised protein [Moraxella lacunata]
MKNQSYRLINADVAENCFKAIHQAVADSKGTPHNVLVTIGIDDDKARSLAQNRLYWSWLHELESQNGQDDEWWHCYFKRLFLSAIYARDDGEYDKMAESIRQCKGLIDDEHYESMAMGVIKKISTTTANTKQFAEYLTKIELWAVANGFGLTTPQELEWAR